jgi:hypothetical protein
MWPGTSGPPYADAFVVYVRIRTVVTMTRFREQPDPHWWARFLVSLALEVARWFDWQSM